MSDLLGLPVKVNQRGYDEWTRLRELLEDNDIDELIGVISYYRKDWGYLVDFAQMGLNNSEGLHNGHMTAFSLDSRTGWWLDEDCLDSMVDNKIDDLL